MKFQNHHCVNCGRKIELLERLDWDYCPGCGDPLRLEKRTVERPIRVEVE